MIFNKRFGRYRLVQKLASGGMAEVFLALKSGPDRFEKLVALKCMHAHLDAESRHVEMFYREARLGAQFRHRNLVHVLDAERIQDRHVMAMEFVPGVTVDVVAERAGDGGLLPVGWALFIASEAALGLHDAHEQRDLDGTPLQVVHRDISPENLLVGFDGSVKLFDFGVAVAASAPDAEGSLAGKTAYMSPEQCRGRAVDRRSDVFALGVVLHELLTGQRLFKRETPVQSIRAITEETPAAPSSVNPAVPPDLDLVVAKALARDPNERYPNARAFHEALAAVQVRHSLFFDAATASGTMARVFRADIDELGAVIEKILAAPEQSDATVDLSTFSASDAAAVVLDEGGGLEQLASSAPAVDLPSATSTAAPFASHASAAVVDQLRRAKRTNSVLLVALLVAVGAAIFAFVGLGTPPPASEVAQQGAVRVTSVPAGASIVIDGVPRTEVTPAQFLLPEGTVTVRLALAGYLDDERSVTVAADNAVDVAATLAPDPDSPNAPIGRMRVVFVPADARLIVNEQEVGQGSPLLVEGLALNREHQIRLEHPGYRPLYQRVTLDNADVLDLQVEMSEAAELGTFNIVSEPAGASVTINGEAVGDTPIADLELAADQTYTIEVDRAGYRTWRRAILLRSGATENVVAELERRGAAQAPAPRERSPRQEAAATPSPAAAPQPAAAPAAAPPAAAPEPSAPAEDRYELME